MRLSVSFIRILLSFVIVTDEYDEMTTQNRLKFHKKTVKNAMSVS